MNEPFAIKGGSDSQEYGVAGDFLVQGENGEQWSVPRSAFVDMYEEVQVLPTLSPTSSRRQMVMNRTVTANEVLLTPGSQKQSIEE
jgi:hypothetical protein